MKHLHPFLLAALCAAALSACSDDKNDKPAVEYNVISFENSEHLADANGAEVSLGDVTMNLYGIGSYTYSNVFCGKAYASGADFDGTLFTTADGSIRFDSYYAGSYDTWGGIALAASPDATAADASLTQQFSVWAASGANNTTNYAVCYDSNTPSEEWPEYMSKSGYPTIRFSKPRVVDHLYLANSTYTCNSFTGAMDDLFEVKITGLKSGAEVGSTTVTLISGTTRLEGWQRVDLATFGAVDQLTFKVTGIDVMTDPTYFCLDEIALVRQ